MPTPLNIELERQDALRIEWSDGRRCEYSLPLLRRACPCAGCREARHATEATLLPVMASAEAQHAMATARGLELVGRYALKLLWQDGHSAGIYDYELLYSLCSDQDERVAP
jgi:DUF971 family protein